MDGEIRLNQLESVIGPLAYPISNDATCEAVAGVTLVYPDGEEPLSAVVARSQAETFDSVEDLETEVFSNVPTEAVGEPGQSEGDG